MFNRQVGWRNHDAEDDDILRKSNVSQGLV